MLNVTSTIAKCTEEITAKIETVRKDLAVVDTLQVTPEIITSVKDYYLRTFDLSGALAEKARLEKVKADIQAIKPQPKVETVIVQVQTAPTVQSMPEQTIERQQLDFRVWVTPDQKKLIHEFLVANKIQFGSVK